MQKGFLGCSVLLLMLACAATAADPPGVRATLQAARERKPAPEIRLPASSGKTITLQDFRGKVVLLDFWATWCHGCQEEIPWFAEFQRKYSAKGLTAIGVSMDEDGWKVVKPFIAAAHVPYTIVLGDGAAGKNYAIEAMPDTFLIDRQGRIAAVYRGLVDRQNIEANIRTMLLQP